MTNVQTHNSFITLTFTTQYTQYIKDINYKKTPNCIKNYHTNIQITIHQTKYNDLYPTWNKTQTYNHQNNKNKKQKKTNKKINQKTNIYHNT